MKKPWMFFTAFVLAAALLANETARWADPFFGGRQAAVAGAQSVLSARPS